MSETKAIPVSKEMVWAAYKKVKANDGGAGVDKESLKMFGEKLEDNLYKVWNRLASGTYFPPPVKEVEIRKDVNKTRKLGIPTVSDRIAQMVVKDYLEPRMEAIFHLNSFGYRPKRNAHDALSQARRNCGQYDWVLDLDIKGFFDNIDHEKLFRAIERHVEEKWVKMYIQRWIKAPAQDKMGVLIFKEGKGTPQGGVISPLLANLFLHYVLDKWLDKHHEGMPFERYADDIIIHCKTQQEVEQVLEEVRERMNTCGLELHPEKTKIVYCKDQKRNKNYKNVKFDFLGYTFKPRASKRRSDGKMFLGFDLSISVKSRKRILETLRKSQFHRWTNNTIEGIAAELNPKFRGWINYYGKYRLYGMSYVFLIFNKRLIKWLQNKYKYLRNSINYAWRILNRIKKNNPTLFEPWKHGF